MADRDPAAPEAEVPPEEQVPDEEQVPPEEQVPDEEQAPVPPVAPDEPPVIPDRSSDDRDEGWGGDGGERDDDWYERERPPHW